MRRAREYGMAIPYFTGPDGAAAARGPSRGDESPELMSVYLAAGSGGCTSQKERGDNVCLETVAAIKVSIRSNKESVVRLDKSIMCGVSNVVDSQSPMGAQPFQACVTNRLRACGFRFYRIVSSFGSGKLWRGRLITYTL
jgi:hypothetical protein